MSGVLRPASLSDVTPICDGYIGQSEAHRREHTFFTCALEELYDAEWKLRGFERSP